MTLSRWPAPIAAIAAGVACAVWASRTAGDSPPAPADVLWLEEAASPRPVRRPAPATGPAMVFADSLPVEVDATSSGAEKAEARGVVALLRSKRVHDFQCEDYDLDQVLRELRRVTGSAVTFFITPRARSTKFDEVQVTLGPLDDVSVHQVLDLITAPYDLKWDVRGDVVRIGTSRDIPSPIRLRYYDLRDLTGYLASRDTDGPAPAAEPALPDGFVPPKVSADGLFVALVRHAVDREAWSQEGASLELKNGILIASAPPPTLDRVQAFVDGVRRLAGVPSR